MHRIAIYIFKFLISKFETKIPPKVELKNNMHTLYVHVCI